MPNITKKNTSQEHLAFQDALRRFLSLKKAEGRSTYTLRDYEAHLKRFYKQYPGSLQDEDATYESLLGYLGVALSPSTYNLRLSYLKSFLEWLVSEEILEKNPARKFKKRKEGSRFVSLDLVTLKKLLALPEHDTYTGLRDYTLILLTMDTGIRPGEALSLSLSDFNCDEREIVVRRENAKTRSCRILPLSPYTCKSITKLIAARHSGWEDKRATLFCSSDGNQLSVTSWGKRLSLYCRKIGVHITPYQLRHAFATQYLKQNGDVFSLQSILGHSGLAMTRRYVHLAYEDLKEKHNLASPVGVLLDKKPMRVRKIKP